MPNWTKSDCSEMDHNGATPRPVSPDCHMQTKERTAWLKLTNNFLFLHFGKLQKDLDRLGEWAAENAMKINPSKCKAVCCTRARVKDPLNCTFGDQLILEVSSCKYLGIILHNDLSWADHVNYMAKKAWKALHFIMRILKRGDRSTKSLSLYNTIVRPILEYGAVCWDPSCLSVWNN